MADMRRTSSSEDISDESSPSKDVKDAASSVEQDETSAQENTGLQSSSSSAASSHTIEETTAEPVVSQSDATSKRDETSSSSSETDLPTCSSSGDPTDTTKRILTPESPSIQETSSEVCEPSSGRGLAEDNPLLLGLIVKNTSSTSQGSDAMSDRGMSATGVSSSTSQGSDAMSGRGMSETGVTSSTSHGSDAMSGRGMSATGVSSSASHGSDAISCAESSLRLRETGGASSAGRVPVSSASDPTKETSNEHNQPPHQSSRRQKSVAESTPVLVGMLTAPPRERVTSTGRGILMQGGGSSVGHCRDAPKGGASRLARANPGLVVSVKPESPSVESPSVESPPVVLRDDAILIPTEEIAREHFGRPRTSFEGVLQPYQRPPTVSEMRSISFEEQCKEVPPVTPEEDAVVPEIFLKRESSSESQSSGSTPYPSTSSASPSDIVMQSPDETQEQVDDLSTPYPSVSSTSASNTEISPEETQQATDQLIREMETSSVQPAATGFERDPEEGARESTHSRLEAARGLVASPERGIGVKRQLEEGQSGSVDSDIILSPMKKLATDSPRKEEDDKEKKGD